MKKICAAILSGLKWLFTSQGTAQAPPAPPSKDSTRLADGLHGPDQAAAEIIDQVFFGIEPKTTKVEKDTTTMIVR